VRRPVLRSCRPERRRWRPISVVVGLERAGRSWFHRGRAACGADRGQNVSSRFFSKCGYQLFRFWSDHGMGPPVRDRASQDHRCVRRRGRRRRHHHCPTTDAGTTSYGNAFAERWIGPGRECLSPHHMIGFSAPPQVMAVVTVNSTSASARTDDRRNHASPGLVTSLSTESTAPVHGRIGSLRRAARVSLCRPCRPCRRSGPRSSPVCRR
jgi:hypothetical protein